MTKFVTVFDHVPALFMQGVADQVQQGYYADDSVAGYPTLEGLIAEVRLFRIKQPVQRNDLSTSKTVVIQGYDNTHFMLDVQDALLQGFEIDLDSVVLGLPHSVTLHKAVQAVLDITPVVVDTPEAESVPESTTEAPEPEQEAPKTTRKSKSKEV